MPLKKYANASPTGRDNNLQVITTSNYNSYCKETNNNYITSNNYKILQETLTKMSPAYKMGKKRRQEDPLSWRIQKVTNKIRPMMSVDKFLEVSKSIAVASPMEQVEIVHKLEVWLDKVHGIKL